MKTIARISVIVVLILQLLFFAYAVPDGDGSSGGNTTAASASEPVYIFDKTQLPAGTKDKTKLMSFKYVHKAGKVKYAVLVWLPDKDVLAFEDETGMQYTMPKDAQSSEFLSNTQTVKKSDRWKLTFRENGLRLTNGNNADEYFTLIQNVSEFNSIQVLSPKAIHTEGDAAVLSAGEPKEPGTETTTEEKTTKEQKQETKPSETESAQVSATDANETTSKRQGTFDDPAESDGIIEQTKKTHKDTGVASWYRTAFFVALFFLLLETVIVVYFIYSFYLKQSTEKQTKHDDVTARPQTPSASDGIGRTSGNRLPNNQSRSVPTSQIRPKKGKEEKPNRKNPKQNHRQKNVTPSEPDIISVPARLSPFEQLHTGTAAPIVEEYTTEQIAPHTKEAPKEASAEEQIRMIYAGTKNPDETSLRIEAIEVTNGYDMMFFLDTLPVFQYSKNPNIEMSDYLLIDRKYLCLSFFKYNTAQDSFRAYDRIAGIERCFDIKKNGRQEKAKGQRIQNLVPALLEQNSSGFSVCKKGAIELGE